MRKWFRLAKNAEYSKQKASHAEYQRTFCFKCFSDGFNRDSSQGTTSMTNHISKYHAGEDAPILQKKKRSAESSDSDA